MNTLSALSHTQRLIWYTWYRGIGEHDAVRALAVTRRRPRITLSLNNTGFSISTAFFRRARKRKERTVVYRAREPSDASSCERRRRAARAELSPCRRTITRRLLLTTLDYFESSSSAATTAAPTSFADSPSARRWWSYRPIVVQTEENPRSNTCKTSRVDVPVVLCTGSPHPRKRTFSPAHTCAAVEHTECPRLTALCVNAQVLQPREIAPLFSLRIYRRNVSDDKLLSSFITNKGYREPANMESSRREKNSPLN